MASGRSRASLRGALFALATVSLGGTCAPDANAEEGMADPFIGQPAAIAAGKDIYRSKCLVCHGSAGARGPNLFATKLSDEGFLKTVTHGREGTQMPAFGQRLSVDEIWQLHAFIKSTDHY